MITERTTSLLETKLSNINEFANEVSEKDIDYEQFEELMKTKLVERVVGTPSLEDSLTYQKLRHERSINRISQ